MGSGAREKREDSDQKAVLGPQHRWSPSPKFDSVSATPWSGPLTKTINLPELSLFCCELERVPRLTGSAAPADLESQAQLVPGLGVKMSGFWPGFAVYLLCDLGQITPLL